MLQFSSSTALLLHQLLSPLTRVHPLDLQNHHPDYHESLLTTKILPPTPQKVYIVYRLGPGSSLPRLPYQETTKVLPQDECDISCIYHLLHATPLSKSVTLLKIKQTRIAAMSVT